MPLSDNTRKRPISLNESYDIVRSGVGTYFTISDPGEKQLWVWGYNAHGELPVGDRIPRSSGIQIPGSNWQEVSVGNHHMLGLKSDGTLWSWGYNNHAMLGQCGVNPNSSPNQLPGTNWCYVSAGDCHSLALKCDGTLWTWGHNNWGQLGLTDCCCGWAGGVGCCKCMYACPRQVAGTTWKCAQITHYSVIGLKCDGTLWSWGHGGHGQLGICCVVCPYPGTCCSPVTLNPATGCNYPCCTGPTDLGPSFSSPTQIPGTNWTTLTMGANLAFATKTDGTLWGWGHNPHGAIGNCSTTDVYCPVQLPGSNWVEIKARSHGFIGRRSDNTLWSWGQGCSGQNAEVNTTADRSSPIQIPGIWIRIGRNGFYSRTSHATKSDCTLWGWGPQDHGELGRTPWTSSNCGGAYQAFDQWGWGHNYEAFSSPTLIAGTCWLCGSNSRHSTAWIKCSG